MLTLEVATPTGLALHAETESVQAPSVEGEFGVLEGHLPLLAALKCGLLKYHTGKNYHFAAVGPGFVQADTAKVLLLTDLYQPAETVDPERVRTELDQAQQALQSSTASYGSAEYRELLRAVQWARARLDAWELRERTV